MPANLLADGNVDIRIVRELGNFGYIVHSISEDYKGLSDYQIIQLAKRLDSVILTLDKDFGEWVFSHKEDSLGVIFLRYDAKEYQKITVSLTKLLELHDVNLKGKFAILTLTKVRIREIHL
ncbi:toxin-antitoxin system, toxin component, PIN domain protein [Leptospira fainei serovar Hurstbridge str. BUT 6]|uniref:Toxin-antitoxin system, toxin component, PIN domain protein n=1 Tax=Leptospira fainei serovar Hurstbridge str. BUT 6 TaxID=1193011 RepID=S3VBJ5_9LEPT|nr:DUF5615 family PIN-like protein [Leptospira fainei]EPG73860.1 toxin-antitoxin system, toxin component, PIN domain protein [Leptospira fainei serovar Hurstbridge str. BUT 6]